MPRRAEPRLLRLMRIDDDLVELADPPPRFLADQLPPRFLEAMKFRADDGEFIGLRSWAMSVDFWNRPDPGPGPDLVISDVQFQDDTSPLARLRPNQKLPTGLGHFKLFAAAAKLRGRPIGIAMHTADPGLWQIMANDADPATRAMSMLAAHEIGELAALLGEANDISGGGLDACWTWLASAANGRATFQDAVPLALERYRARIGQARILPSDWERAAGWCAGMAARCAQHEDGVVFLQDSRDDPGLTIQLEDGTCDTISFRSLFADAELGGSGFRFDLTGLPPECFEVAEHPEHFKLTDDGLPRIGALVAACGRVRNAYATAVAVLENFRMPPDGPRATDLSKALEQRGAEPLSGGLAVLLQHVAYEHLIHGKWQELVSEIFYDPQHDAFSTTGSARLLTWLEDIYDLAVDEDEISLNDLKEHLIELNDLGLSRGAYSPDGPERLLQALVDSGHLRWDLAAQTYRPVAKKVAIKAPPVPARPPTGFFIHSGLSEEFREGQGLREPSGILLHVFGYDRNLQLGRKSDNGHAIPRIVRDAFGLRDEGEATAFLRRFRSGQAPTWVRDLCREYALEVLDWADEATWPAMIAR